MRKFSIPAILIAVVLIHCSWGFFAHRRINRLSVFILPEGMNGFYKRNINYLTEHATDPDKRRYLDTTEAPRHYLDVENYESSVDSIPVKWEDALKKYGARKLSRNGILPWHIRISYYKLVRAFEIRDSAKILQHSAFLGHYIADAHVPLHTTANHNGQLTHQEGIHGFWESRLPELFADQYNFVVGRAQYIGNPLTAAWKIVRHSHSLADSVLKLELSTNGNFRTHRKYGYSKRNGQLMKQYSYDYANAYHASMNRMVERQMRSAVLAIGSFWFSAWVDAGQPSLERAD